MLQLSVTAMQAAPTTEESPPKKAAKIVVLMEHMMAVDEATAEVVDVNSTDIALPSEGENILLLYSPKFVNYFSESEKQAAHGWGANDGEAELNDEQAGEAIAKADEKEALTGDGDVDATDGAGEPAAEAEPEDNNISYADYLAQQAEKKLALGTGVPEARKPSKVDKKWANAKAISKEEEEDFVAGSGGKAKRERERKQKQLLEIDQRFVEAPERGGRGGFRGGRGRGDGPSRGGRGEFRGRGDRGGDRGGRSRGDRPPRGPPRNNAPAATINTSDESAFPSLGS